MYVHSYTHIHMHIYKHVPVLAYTCIRTCVYDYVNINDYVNIDDYVYDYTHSTVANTQPPNLLVCHMYTITNIYIFVLIYIKYIYSPGLLIWGHHP
jgi:hypothetical protein